MRFRYTAEGRSDVGCEEEKEMDGELMLTSATAAGEGGGERACTPQVLLVDDSEYTGHSGLATRMGEEG